jgi:MFS family permease
MIAKYNRKSLAFGIPAILLQIGLLALIMAFGLKDGDHGKAFPAWASALFGLGMVVGAILWIVGLCYYALAKGYRAGFGLLGIFSWIGLLILFVLPDQTKVENPDAN